MIPLFASAAAFVSPYLGKITLVLGGLLALVIALGSAWYLGKLDERADNRAALAEFFEKKVELLEREAKVKVQEQAAATKQTGDLVTKQERGKAALSAAIEKAGDKPACALTEEEVRALNAML